MVLSAIEKQIDISHSPSDLFNGQTC